MINETTLRKYRKARKDLPLIGAQHCLRIAKAGDHKYEWQTEASYTDMKLTTEVDGYTLTIEALCESIGPVDGDLGEYVQQSRYNEQGDSMGEETPLNLPDAHFKWPSTDHNAYEFFVPDNVEDQYDWARKRGYAKGPAREYVTKWVESWISELVNLENYVVTVSASFDGIELGSASIGGCDYIDMSTDDLIEIAEEHGMIDEALEQAKEEARAIGAHAA